MQNIKQRAFDDAHALLEKLGFGWRWTFYQEFFDAELNFHE